MTGLVGKGFFIWKIQDCEGGNPQAIAAAAQQAGFSHVLIKIADGGWPVNIDRKTNTDLLPPIVQANREKGIQVWGWHYVYGNDPLAEANVAIRRIQQFQLDGYVIDAEIEYKQAGKERAARRFMSKLREALPNLPMALSSYRFPSYHPQLPWKVFLEYVDYNMPQVYWEKAHNPEAQLRRSVREFQGMTPFRPVIPTGPTYKSGGWAPTEQDTLEFLRTVQALGLSAVNFFSWDECRKQTPSLWDVIAHFSWTPQPPPPDIIDLYFQALNLHDPSLVLHLYHPDAVHVTPARVIQGSQAIRAWYTTLFNELLPAATFTLTHATQSGSSRHFNWTAQSGNTSVKNGSDTVGIMDGKIAYHYTNFTITA